MPRTEAGDRLWRVVHAAAGLAGIGSDIELAEQADVRRASLSQWLTGEAMPSVQSLAKLARPLSLRVEDLLAAIEGRDGWRTGWLHPVSDLGDLRAYLAKVEREQERQGAILDGLVQRAIQGEAAPRVPDGKAG